MKNIIIIVALLVCTPFMAQQLKINGIVTDFTNTPLPGVNVLKKGTTSATQTDFDGAYSIRVSKGDILVFSYVGFKTKEVKIDSLAVLDITMEEDAAVLEEVVIVSYGTAVKSYTPSRKRIKRNKQKAYHQSISRQLQGKAPGIRISNTIVAPKGRDRKASKKDEVPLYIVDGTPISKHHNNTIQNLPSESIDKINTYKGAKARQLFGNSAKNGCIVITTKRGNYTIENDENYAKISKNTFENVQLSPLSTFSIDVDKASYSNIRRLLNNGQPIDVDAVKIEEMINYFDYDYHQPKDEHPFAIHTEVSQTPWNPQTNLVRIGLQGKEYLIEELPASNLTFLIDVSGSMSDANKLPLLKSAFKLLVNQLREKDKVSIVVYAGAAGVVLEPTNGKNRKRIFNALENLEAGGSTAGGEGIELAYKLAEKNFKKSGNNRVILATDGDFNVGASSNVAMEKLIEKKRKTGVFLSVLGFGMGNYQDSKLETLADKGNGNHAYIDTMQEAQKIFGKEFGGTLYTIAKDVKIQVEFNPNKVQAYRLIGYENRLLADEDFVDDTKDAGELGSGHTVTALYEVIPIGTESTYLKDIPDLKYTKKGNDSNFSDELLTVKFRYKKPNEAQSIEMVHVHKNSINEMSDDFKFASSVALFGMQLRKSAYTNGTMTKDIIRLAETSRGTDENGYRAEFIRLVKSYENSL